MDRIQGLELTIGRDAYLKSKTENAEATTTFKDILSNALNETERLYGVTETDTQALLSGEVDDVAQVMINGSKFEMSLNMVVQVRNKLLDAYNEIMRMQV